ncbi:polysaccharide deacetylase family protein [Streptomyces sp. SP18CS02]|uniref:polysaccharide deacetylase family protein n=1 Tax=Streptomyces sp. SP18CS02 TaxID=3002531 RepID=UPI002E78D603|nr:polysaccharide deacetylase family protein [Streptomyces sp. SP18CS02]MEE1756064.1 polysaccharide deacetylase family protein [Streptomyces sp. SP18CS02]
MRKRSAGAAAVAALLISGLIAGCSTESTASPARPSAEPAASPGAPGGAGGGKGKGSAGGGPEQAAAAAYEKWGLKPFAPPPAPPAVKPVGTGAGQVPVISDIPTKDKIVFVTFDDGAEKDPEFVEMMRDLKVPFTMFLTDAAIKSDYGYFERLAELGNGVANHTLGHPNLRTLDASAQQREICGQQTRLAEEYGTTPRLLRPPYGNWNEDTRAAAGRCGVEAIVLWRESMQITNMQYQRGDKKLHPGDIILAHFRGPADLKGTSMTEMTANMLRRIQEQGFTVARLEDYV